MSEFNLRYPASAIAEKHRLSVDDVVLLRKHMFPKGVVSPADALQVIALHRSPVEKCAEWDNWFVEMLTAFIVVQSRPQYSLDKRNVDWLIAAVSVDGIIESCAELELVLHVMEMTTCVPDNLSAFALDQLRIALETRTGAHAKMRDVKRRGVAKADIDLIYRILRGSLIEGKMMLSAAEVAVFDRIDVLVRNRTNHPAWRRLTRSIAKRTSEGYVSASPWLKMQIDDIALDCAA